MKSLLICIILFLLIVIGTSPMMAQSFPGLKSASKHVAIMSKADQNGVHLRWAPTEFSIWLMASKQGYVLERATWDEENYPLDNKKLNFQLLGRLTALKKNEWEQQIKANDTISLIAAQSLFGNEETKAQKITSMASAKLISEQQGLRHAMGMLAADLSRDAAKGLGLYFYDQTTEPGKDYIYRIRIEDNKAKTGADTAFTVVNFKGVHTMIPSVAGVKSTGLNKSVLLQWPKELNRTMFTAFHVERSLDNKNFIRLTPRPITNAEGDDQGELYDYTDKDLEIGKKYYYRILGITPFAEISETGESVECIPLDLSGPLPPETVTVKQGLESFILEWTIPNHLISEDCIGWIVKRSIVASGPYANVHDGVLPLKQMTYTDKTPVPLIGNYYRIYAVDNAGNETPSIIRAAIWEDSTPPAAPQNVTATIDSSGIVSLIWNQNNELDLQGYRVFVRDDKNKEWYQLTDALVFNTAFTDSVDVMTLNKTIEYTVVALDFHYNVSEFAKPFTLLLPDFIAPVPPRWAEWQKDDNQLSLSWYASASNDVKTQKLLVQYKGEQWKTLMEFDGATSSYGYKMEPNKILDVALIAIDQAGNSSDTLFLRNISTTMKSKLEGVSKVEVKNIPSENAMELSWTYNGPEQVRFEIFRKDIQSDDLEEVGTFNETTRKIIDKGPSSFTNGFSYFIKVNGEAGSSSDWNGPYTVRYKN